MPTAGRLAAALAYFIYGWYMGILMAPMFPEGVAPWFLIPLGMGLGVVIGWRMVGSRAGRGYMAAIGNGLTGAFAFAAWMIFLLSCHSMVRKSLRNLYDGPMEAVVDIFKLMMELALDFVNVELIVTLLVGGIVGAFVSEYFAKRYP